MRTHSEEIFKQLPEEVQQHMSAELSEKASDLPTSDRTYGDTGQLLGLTPKQPGQDLAPATMAYSELDARIRPAPGRSTTATTTTDSGLRSVGASLHYGGSVLGSPDSRSTQRARGGTQMHPSHRESSSNTMRSDGEGDWETTRSESRIDIRLGLPRPSEDSYANTSTYNEDIRLSAMSDATIAGRQSYRPYRATHTLRLMDSQSNEEDVERARKALEKICKDKVPELSLIHI